MVAAVLSSTRSSGDLSENYRTTSVGRISRRGRPRSSEIGDETFRALANIQINVPTSGPVLAYRRGFAVRRVALQSRQTGRARRCASAALASLECSEDWAVPLSPDLFSDWG